jgi:hypothetical protein
MQKTKEQQAKDLAREKCIAVFSEVHRSAIFPKEGPMGQTGWGWSLENLGKLQFTDQGYLIVPGAQSVVLEHRTYAGTEDEDWLIAVTPDLPLPDFDPETYLVSYRGGQWQVESA